MAYSAPEAGAFAKKSGTLSEKITYELGLIEDEQPTGDVVGTTDSQTLTNKRLDGTTGTSFTVDSDATTGKIAVTVAAGAANKTLTLTNAALTDNRTITFPDTAGTVVLQDMTSQAAAAGTGTPVFAIGDLDGARASTATANFVPLQVNIAQNADIGADNTCAAGYVKTATGIAQAGQLATWLVRTALSHNVFDAYGVQSHLDINANMSASASGNLAAVSAKVDLNTFTVGAGQVQAGLFIIDGSTAAAVTSTDCDGVQIKIESGVPNGVVDSCLRLGSRSTINAGIRCTGTSYMTNLFDFDAVAGCLTADTGTPIASTHKIKIDMGGTAGYIAVYADY